MKFVQGFNESQKLTGKLDKIVLTFTYRTIRALRNNSRQMTNK